MQTKLGHVVFSIDSKNRSFYRDLFQFLGWQTIYDGDGMLGIYDSNQTSVWFGDATKSVANDYDAPGLNHFAVHTGAQSEVDDAVDYLRKQGIAPLFDTPRHRPEFSSDPNATYYQVMFETPDRILGEIVYIGQKS